MNSILEFIMWWILAIFTIIGGHFQKRKIQRKPFYQQQEYLQ